MALILQLIQSEDILKDYDLILIPEWVLTEINDAPGRSNYVKGFVCCPNVMD